MFTIIDIDTGERIAYYAELRDAVRDMAKAVEADQDRLLVLMDTERETVLRWAF